jgi:hypothetical protein
MGILFFCIVCTMFLGGALPVSNILLVGVGAYAPPTHRLHCVCEFIVPYQIPYFNVVCTYCGKNAARKQEGQVENL